MNRPSHQGSAASPATFPKPSPHADAGHGAAKRSGAGRALRILVPVLISVALVYFVFRGIENPATVWQNIREASLAPLLVLVPLALASHWLRAWRWRRFIGEKASLFYGFTSIMIGYAVNDVLPRVGEVARVVNMNRMTKIPLAKLVATLAAERLLDVIALVICLGLSLLLEGDGVFREFPEFSRFGPLSLGFSILGLAGLFTVAYFPPFYCGLVRFSVGRISSKWAVRFEALVLQGAEGLEFLKRPLQAFFVFIETAGIWLIYCAGFLLGLQAFGILSEVGFDGGTVSFSITVAGVLVPAVGAIGTYHEFGVQSLTRLYAVDPARALACVTVIHAILFYFVGGVCGALAWGLQAWVSRRQERQRLLSLEQKTA